MKTVKTSSGEIITVTDKTATNLESMGFAEIVKRPATPKEDKNESKDA